MAHIRPSGTSAKHYVNAVLVFSLHLLGFHQKLTPRTDLEVAKYICTRCKCHKYVLHHNPAPHYNCHFCNYCIFVIWVIFYQYWYDSDIMHSFFLLFWWLTTLNPHLLCPHLLLSFGSYVVECDQLSLPGGHSSADKGLPLLFISKWTGSGLASKSRSRWDQTPLTSYILGLCSLRLQKQLTPPRVLRLWAACRPSPNPPNPQLPLTVLALLSVELPHAPDFVWKAVDSDGVVHKQGVVDFAYLEVLKNTLTEE